MGKILLTGFEPFAGLPYNPSAEILKNLPPRIGSHVVCKEVLPVDYVRLPAVLKDLYAMKPIIVLHTGLAIDRRCLTVEQVGVNRLEFDLADNSGAQIRGKPIVEGGPAELSARMPVRSIISILEREGIHVEKSNSAGTFLCNQSFYLSLYHLPKSATVGFFHLVADETLGEIAGLPPTPLLQQAAAVKTALEFCTLSRMLI